MLTRCSASASCPPRSKCLRANNAALQRESTGRIVTLMSNDSQKIQDVMLAIHACWASPIYILAVLAMLYLQVQWATFVGLGVMMMLGPMTGIVATRLARLRREILKFVDKRVGLVSEVIPGIRVIKFYAWERSFLSRIIEIRNGEVGVMKKVAILTGFFGMVLFAGPVAVGLFCFMSYTLAGNVLTASHAYAALAYFNLLRFPMSFLPMFIQMLITANVALKRIQAFLMQPDAPEALDSPEGLPRGAVRVTAADFAWETPEDKAKEAAAAKLAAVAAKGQRGGPPGAGAPPGGGKGKGRGGKGSVTAPQPPAPHKPAKEEEEDANKPWRPTLTGIDVSAEPGQLVMVAGAVGSGKSSLLATMIGNITKVSGKVQVQGKVAYVAQTSWIINDTVRTNVLLGEPFDEARYREALRVSQLDADLKILPAGDLTEIGERGVNLSGGQKQRVSIARAVYSNADVYLMDDPLSAVDSHVGRALFEQCIRGALKEKTVVLVTNALYYLPYADQILWLEDGRVAASGRYQELMQAGGNFAALINKTVIQEDHQHEEEEENSGAAELKKGPEPSAGVVATVDVAKAKGDGKAPGAAGPPGGVKNLTGVEEREAGNVSSAVVGKYIKAAGGLGAALAVVGLFAIEQCLRVGTDLWVGVWTLNQAHRGLSYYIGSYFAWGIGYSIASFLRTVTFMLFSLNATRVLHHELLHHVVRLPMSFFDTNPTGRILNRFSRDVEIMDSVLNASLIQFLGSVANLLTTCECPPACLLPTPLARHRC